MHLLISLTFFAKLLTDVYMYIKQRIIKTYTFDIHQRIINTAHPMNSVFAANE